MLIFCMLVGVILGGFLGYWLVGGIRKDEPNFEKFVIRSVGVMSGGTILFAALLSFFVNEGEGIIKWSGLVFGGAFVVGGLVAICRTRAVPATVAITNTGGTTGIGSN